MEEFENTQPRYLMQRSFGEITVKSILSRSGIPGMKYCLNPYVGCAHACRYCYATYMKRFTGHTEPWGSFVDAKINAAELLRKQLKRAEIGGIMISSVTDPYQNAEKEYLLTRKCLEILRSFRFPVSILTKSPLVLRDADIIAGLQDAEVGMTITTDDERIRKIFEPGAPVIADRVEALKELHKAGISTYVFIGPVLPMNPEALARLIVPYADSVLISRMNYISKTSPLYRHYGIEKWLDPGFTENIVSRLKRYLPAHVTS